MIKVITAENFTQEVLENKSKVLLDLYADWCGPCKMLAPVIEQVANENNDITVGKLNVDISPEIAIRYNVVSIPTLILFENGNVKDIKVGLVGKDTILGMIK